MQKLIVIYFILAFFPCTAQTDSSLKESTTLSDYDKGYALVCARYYPQAIEVLEKALIRDTNDLTVASLLYYAKYMASDSSSTQILLTKIDSLVNRTPTNVYAYSIKCYILFEQQYYDEAFIGFKSILNSYNHRKDIYRCHFYIGYIYYIKGKKAEALQHLRLYNHGLENCKEDFFDFLCRHREEYRIDEFIRSIEND